MGPEQAAMMAEAASSTSSSSAAHRVMLNLLLVPQQHKQLHRVVLVLTVRHHPPVAEGGRHVGRRHRCLSPQPKTKQNTTSCDSAMGLMALPTQTACQQARGSMPQCVRPRGWRCKEAIRWKSSQPAPYPCPRKTVTHNTASQAAKDLTRYSAGALATCLPMLDPQPDLGTETARYRTALAPGSRGGPGGGGLRTALPVAGACGPDRRLHLPVNPRTRVSNGTTPAWRASSAYALRLSTARFSRRMACFCLQLRRRRSLVMMHSDSMLYYKWLMQSVLPGNIAARANSFNPVCNLLRGHQQLYEVSFVCSIHFCYGIVVVSFRPVL